MDNNNNKALQQQLTANTNMRRRDSVAPDMSDTNHMDVHVSLLPVPNWSGELNCAPYQSIADAITLGCIRCHVNSSVIAMRQEISQQLGDDKKLPGRYIFLKGVGRALVPIRPKQEQILTVENFRSIGSRLPPEICLLDASALDKSHTGQLPDGGVPRKSGNFTQRNDSGIDSSTQLKERVNASVRERQSTSKTGKGNPQKVADVSRGSSVVKSSKGKAKVQRETTVDKLKSSELSRINDDGNNRGVAYKDVRRASVKFPPIEQLEEYSDQQELPRNSHIRTSRIKQQNSPTQQSAQSNPIQTPRRSSTVRKSSIKQPASPPKLPPRRLSIAHGTISDADSDESLVIVPRSSVSKARNLKTQQVSNISPKSAPRKPQKFTLKQPQNRKSLNRNPSYSDLSDEIMSTSRSMNERNQMKINTKKGTKYNQNNPKYNNNYNTEINETAKITKLKNKSDKSSTHKDGTHSEPQRVESYEEFYRRKSVNMEVMDGLQCPDCGQIFKSETDSKRHFNLIHRTSKKQIEAKKRIQSLRQKKTRPSRWGPSNVGIGGLVNTTK